MSEIHNHRVFFVIKSFCEDKIDGIILYEVFAEICNAMVCQLLIRVGIAYNAPVRIGKVNESGLIDEVWSTDEPVKPDPYLKEYDWFNK